MVLLAPLALVLLLLVPWFVNVLKYLSLSAICFLDFQMFSSQNVRLCQIRINRQCSGTKLGILLSAMRLEVIWGYWHRDYFDNCCFHHFDHCYWHHDDFDNCHFYNVDHSYCHHDDFDNRHCHHNFDQCQYEQANGVIGVPLLDFTRLNCAHHRHFTSSS